METNDDLSTSSGEEIDQELTRADLARLAAELETLGSSPDRIAEDLGMSVIEARWLLREPRGRHGLPVAGSSLEATSHGARRAIESRTRSDELDEQVRDRYVGQARLSIVLLDTPRHADEAARRRFRSYEYVLLNVVKTFQPYGR